MVMLSIVAFAQHEKHIVTGKVVTKENKKKIPLPGAFVRWQDKESGVFTNENGEFKIEHHHESPFLVISYSSYKSDTLKVVSMDNYYTIVLSNANELKGATVLGKRITYGLSRLDPRTTVLLSEREFQKAACCNLSESFENAPAIDVAISDAVTGTKQIKMLGLDGFYTLIGKEYMPTVRTLNVYHGLSLIPAAWVDGIQITKGAGSVVNGYESMAGQINIELKKPFGKENLLLDQFVAQSGRAETDFMYRKDINKNLATNLFARASFNPRINDRNQDGFLDMPVGKQFQVLNRWQYANENGLEGIVSVGYIDDAHNGGQVASHEGDNNAYGLGLSTKKFDAVAKVGKVLKGKPNTSIGTQFMFNNLQFDGEFGNVNNGRNYNASSSTLYMNLMYQSYIGNTNHQFQTGLSLQSDDMEESFEDYKFSRIETVPGAFFEYTYKPKETFSLVGGIRTDYNLIYGWSITPRIHSKYRFNKEKTALRLSAGMGRRTSNPLAQNQQIFASSRQLQFFTSNLDFPYGLEQEVSVNSGISLQHEFRLGYMPTTVAVDFFNTTFLNEVVVDRESSARASFYNQKNGTVANSLQAQLDLTPARRTDIRFAYRMFDVKTQYLGYGYMPKPFISKHRGFVNITQKTRTKWQFSSTATWYGKQRIPGATALTLPSTQPIFVSKYSPSFMLINAQVSKTFKNVFELYIGGENLLNYTQENPIQEAANPFDQNFDAGLVWGPIFGRMIYGGFRWRLRG